MSAGVVPPGLERLIGEFLDSAVVPLLRQVLIKKLGQAAAVVQDELVNDALIDGAKPGPIVYVPPTPADEDVKLLRNAVALAHTNSSKAGPFPRWVHVMSTFSVGSTSAQGLCRRFGLDPEKVLTRRSPVDWGPAMPKQAVRHG